MTQYRSAENALRLIKSNQRVFVQGGCSTPQVLLRALCERASELRDVEIIQIYTEGFADYASQKYKDNFRVNTLFVSGNVRDSVRAGFAQYNPVFLSEVPRFFHEGILPVDVVLINVSPPDENGYCSLGVSVDVTRAACDTASVIIAQINPHVPFTYGDGDIHISRFAACVEADEPLFSYPVSPPGETDRRIGAHIAGYIPDGATLQIGIGGIPNGVLSCLGNHKHLGVHTELVSDGILSLIESGVIDNSCKKVMPGRTVAGFAMGSKALYNYFDRNPAAWIMDTAFVNDPAVIRQNPKMTAINSAIEVDITGQVCADSIGTQIYSGVGGQADFVRGTAFSEGGKSFIALPSVTSAGISRIVPTLQRGAGVVTSRFDAQFIVSEYGVADLRGKNLAQRAFALINIAAPQFRDELERAARERYGYSFVSFNTPRL